MANQDRLYKHEDIVSAGKQLLRSVRRYIPKQGQLSLSFIDRLRGWLSAWIAQPDLVR